MKALAALILAIAALTSPATAFAGDRCTDTRPARLASLQATGQHAKAMMIGLRPFLAPENWIEHHRCRLTPGDAHGDMWCDVSVLPKALTGAMVFFYLTAVDDPHRALDDGEWAATNLECDDADTFAGYSMAEAHGTIFNVTIRDAIHSPNVVLRILGGK